METTTARLLDRRTSRGRQSIDLDSIWDLYGTKLRVSIQRDSYDSQSHARVEVFDKVQSKWNYLAHIPFEKMVATMRFHYASSVDPHSAKVQEALTVDESELLRLAELILG